MTLFGKLIMTGLFLTLGVGVYIWVSTYMKNDTLLGNPSSQGEVATSTEEAQQMATSSLGTSTEPIASSTEKKSDKKVSFTEFLNKGGSYKCAVTQTISTMVSNGTVYIHDALVRAEFATTMAGQSISTTMVARDGYTYTWTNMSKGKGYKTKIAANGSETSDASGKPSSTYSWNGSQIGEYSCESWKADDSLFELPKDIVFSEQR